MLPRHELDAIRFGNLAESVLAPRFIRQRVPLIIRAWQTMDHLGPDGLDLHAFTPVELGWRWGPPWSTTWFHLAGALPESFAGSLALQFSSGTEATLWLEGTPFHGLDANRDLIRLPAEATSKGEIDFLVEAACTLPLGASTFWWDHPEVQARWKEDNPGRLESAALVELDESAWQLHETWDFARRLLLALPAEQEASARLLAGLHDIAARLPDDDPTLLHSDLKALLSETGPASGGPCIATGHAHIDTAWLWPLSETRRKCLRTFATMLRLMERYDEFRFLCSQAQQYAWIEQDSPALFDQIAQRVREGRWEAGGAMWIEPDCNVPSGESLIRQILHGTNWWHDRFGEAAAQRHLYLPDTFGFPASLPQIIRLAGLDTFITNKISWCETNRFPHVTFRWKGIDGTDVVTHLTPGHNYNSPIDPSDVLAGHGILMGQPQPRPDAWLQPFGYGDGGGGPTDSMIERIGLSAACTGLPEVKHGRADDFCGLLHAQTKDLPTWDGDLYLELHRGTYTSQSWLKMANRVAEDDLRCIEAMGVGGPQAGDTVALRETLDETWKLVLLNQFHDILPGSPINQVYRDARAQYDQVQSRCQDSLQAVSEAWTSHVGSGVVCFNPASTDRSGVVDLDGSPAWIEAVPALGARAVVADSGTSPPDAVEIDGLHIRNGLIEATLDEVGRVSHLACRGANRSVTDRTRPMGQLVLYEDQPRRWEAWDIDADYVETAQPVESVAEMEIVESHPLRSIIEFRRALGHGSRLVQRYVLRAGSPRLDVEYLVDWQEDQKLLRLSCPTVIRARHGTVGIQFGVQERPTHRNTSWEQARFEFPGHRFMDLSEPGRGLAVLDDGRYGRSFNGDTLGLSLLRAPRMPDPEADRGTHRFTVSFMPHAGDWRDAGVWSEAEALCRPLRLLGTATGTEPKSAPLKLHVDGGAQLEIAAFKPAEHGPGRVLRIVEVHGGAGDVEIEWGQPPARVRSVDLHESKSVEIDLAHDQGRTRLGIRPFQVVTLLVDDA
ncbi:MAG: glycoside hydrolase family 38 C-terminal domain-containing protein [Planctomycetota bacterium]|nr:glycoside hydrolase family 38 C-terminal domain-containing protein [Planctomycetota bacterium]